jgi:hypothetical protein
LGATATFNGRTPRSFQITTVISINKMKKIKETKYGRRRFLSEAAMSLGAAELAMLGLINTSIVDNNDKKIMSNYNENPFDTIKQINAGLLNVGYVEAGPSYGTAVILLHGWPYDIYSFTDVTPILVEKGYRVIVPYLRGFGTTHFLSDDTFRNGQQSVIAVDVINLMDALKIKQAVIAGFDWVHGQRISSLHCGRSVVKRLFL